ncbi:RNA polymerase sigma-B factor [Streptomyces sp. DvalAA-14]|uniref:SigB/SigF/SigG family RNA polymerase sigma factor n=1 Tax=unclassified Streptomyces TaxID=2593676 RepID=UPI00081B6517|nr:MULTISPECIES: SigB/SigF/SigG family RNA polymerase sigma factor [unclassified Streptomyces]MYS21720.1 SigB/SigF/SigG family RNA polymerase sigma factor [Streptomyces sp. SID4948]SCD99588.1 RNA polymerase sigma-B factor [Streptomyces sp. DvalAA-14]
MTSGQQFAAASLRPARAEIADLPWIEDAGKVAPGDARELSKLFFDRLRSLEEGTREYSYARGTLIEMNMSLVRFAARRFRGRSPEEMEDILQVGTVGLIKAIDRFDLSREVEFTTFAVPYIVGEMKRFFRDTSWAVHVPRRLQELRLELAKARDHLTALLDSPPTVAELAAYLEISEEEVIEGLIAANGYSAESIDLPPGDTEEDDGRSYADIIGAKDPAMELVEDFHALAPLLAGLDDREVRLLQMRYGQEMTQAEIGAELGCSQMHVSRLLNRLLAKLRAGMLTEH